MKSPVHKDLMSQWVRWLNYVCQRHPLAFGVAVSTGKAVTADVVAQKVLEGKEKLDRQRILVFSCFGFFYCGLAQHAIYCVAYPRLVSALALRQPAQAIFQIAVDQVLHIPFFYFPVFYTASGLLGARARFRSWVLRSCWVLCGLCLHLLLRLRAVLDGSCQLLSEGDLLAVALQRVGRCAALYQLLVPWGHPAQKSSGSS